MQNEKLITFKEREFKGSRFRCLMLTSLGRQQFADFMTALVRPHAEVKHEHKLMPCGFLKPDEVKLGETRELLSDGQRETLTKWWLQSGKGANTPNWDIVCECSMLEGKKKGLILVEAKAHEGEFNCKTDNCGAKEPNKSQIQASIKQANDGLNEDVLTRFSGWSLSSTKCYQLSNRFAWAWKIAGLGVPVILVYLGFQNAGEMTPSSILTSTDSWRKCVLSRSKGIVPAEVWGQKLLIGKTPLVSLICSVDVNIGLNNP